MRNKYVGAFALVLLAAFLYLLMQIAMLPLESGDAYPAYSTLRTDPRGAKALFESLVGLRELNVSQNFQPVPKLKGSNATVLMLGERVQSAAGWSEGELKLFESIANEGGRLVIAFLPVAPEAPARSSPPQKDSHIPEISKRWHISIERYVGTEDQIEEAGSMPRETSAYLEIAKGSGWRVIDENDDNDAVMAERVFGKGQIVLLTESYPLSNEGLRADMNTGLIAKLAGPSTRIVFDEAHLGVSNTGSVGTLIRRYRLTGAFAMMLLLGLLFLWKNSTSLMPQVQESLVTTALGADSQAGLVNLLKRSVPAAQLARACWERWKETRVLGRPISEQRVVRAESVLASAAPESPAAIYRKIQSILTEKT